MASQPENSPKKLGVMSPFDHLKTEPPKDGGSPDLQNALLMIGIILVILLGVVTVLLVWKRTVDNPYRTLEVFSAEKYFENPGSLTGNRFQATLRVEGDLGWSAGVGKLMVFSVDGDSRFVPVLVPDDKSNYTFSKGQTYLAKIYVQEGGLLNGTDFKKN